MVAKGGDVDPSLSGGREDCLPFFDFGCATVND
jgi:hypothetical protein